MSTERPRQPHHSPKIVNESIRSLVQRIPRFLALTQVQRLESPASDTSGGSDGDQVPSVITEAADA